MSDGLVPDRKDIPKFLTILKMYGQQKYMYDHKVHSVPDRIVSISQPWLRPIVRGRATAPVEFGAKFDLCLDTEGHARIEEDIMKVGILCAGDEEVAPFLPLINEYKVSQKAMLKFYEGSMSGVEVVVLFSGVCKVNAAIASQILIDTYGADIIINAGTAGGVHHELELFDTVISTEIAYHDVAPDILTEFHPWMKTIFFEADQELIELSRVAVSRMKTEGKVFWGRMVTGESFITDAGRQKIIDDFAPLTVDMESASIAHVCYVNSIPFLSIRSITDTAAHNGIGNFEENCAKASRISRDITVALLNEIRNK